MTTTKETYEVKDSSATSTSTSTSTSTMPTDRRGRIAIIGGGVSGISAAHVWQRCGYEVQIYEASDRIGGQWNESYPGVAVQNTSVQYQFVEYGWPFEPDRHATGEQILDYIDQAVKHFDVRIQLNTLVKNMVKEEKGWTLVVEDTACKTGNLKTRKEKFDYVTIATGQFPGNDNKYLPPFPGIEKFKGKVVRNVQSHEVFDKRRVAVIGFGKTALDSCTMSVPRAEQTFHIFRTPRWAIPDYILGIDYTRPFFARFGSDMMPSWHYSWSLQRMLHGPLSFIVDSFWKVLCRLFWFQHVRNAKLGDKDISVLDIVKPPASQFRKDLRSAALVAPNRYFEYLAHGKIEAKHAQVQSFTEDGIVLSTGETIKVDVVCVCCGNQPQSYSFLPEAYRQVLTNKRGGASLYRFAVDPRIPDLGFNIVNCFLQLAFCHLSTLWQVAVHEGQIQLPSEHTMLEEAQCVARWKSDHSAFEPSANSSVNTRFQQMLDLLCQDLGLNMWRKMPNVFAEIFLRYDPTDYAGVIDEYLTKTRKKNLAGPPSVPQLMTCMLDKKKKERTAKGGRSSIQKPVEEHPLLQHSAVSTSDEKRSFASRIDSAAWEVP